MEAPTLELKHLTEENDKKKETANDRSNSPYSVTPTPLPPYSDMDHSFAGPECKGYSNKGNTLDSDNSSGKETRDTSIRVNRSDGTVHALSGLYAQIVVVLAAILVFTEVLHGPIPLLFFHGYLFTYLVGGSILVFAGIYVSMLIEKCPQFMNRDYDVNSDKSPFSTPFMRNLLNSDISIYLRIGAVVFGLGTLISSSLEVASLFTMSSDCMDDLNSAQTVLRGLFSFLQMHFLFMNAREIVHSLGWFRHAALMHLVATNVSIWIRLVLWESAKDWLDATHEKHNASVLWKIRNTDISMTLHTLESDKKSSDLSKHIPVHSVYTAKQCYWGLEAEEGNTEDLIALHLCLQNSTIGAIWEQAMPYVYPFIIQYSLVAAGVIYIIWSNLETSRSKLRQMTAVSVYGDDPREQQMNCAGSTRGLFLGFIVLVAGIICLILFFVLAKDKSFNVLFLITSLRCGILGISALAAALGIMQIRKMKSKTKRERRLMEMLQRTGMLAVYVFGICSMIVGGTAITKTPHLLLFLDGMLMVIQACLQSLFIHQVSKKRLGPSNMDDKPGRQVVIFLVFSNMVLWLLESFTTQSPESTLLQINFFGAIAWPVISRFVMPLVIFYRFHSAVALMEAWKKSYKIKHN